MKSVAPSRLQAALGYWQDTCWFLESSLRTFSENGKLPQAFFPVVPPQIRNWRKLESLVFHNAVPNLQLNEWDTSDVSKQWEFPEFDAMYRFPFEFFEWSRKSRRVFHLPFGLWNTLVSATFPAVRWKDVLFPFESFIITLEGGLITCDDESGVVYEYDTILVARTTVASGISVRLLGGPTSGSVDRRLPDDAKRRFEIIRKRGDDKKTIRFLDQKLEGWRKINEPPPAEESLVFFRDGTLPESFVRLEPLDLVEQFTSHARVRYATDTWGGDVVLPALSDAAKIVVGWCLYLRTISSSQISWKHEERRQPKRGTRGVTGIITQPEHICSILGEARLDPSSYGLTEPRSQNSGFFKRPHWRSAYWRRPRGAPPTADKTEKVDSTLIRGDLVPIFGIIGGTKTEVLPDE